MNRTPDQQNAIDVVNGWARRLVMPPAPRLKTRRQASQELLDVVTFLEQQWPLSSTPETTPSIFGGLIWPIEGHTPSRDQISPGGWSNDHLARGGGEALDLAVPVGTMLVALHEGVVTQAGWLGDAGIAVTMEWDEDGHHYLSRHCHLEPEPGAWSVRLGETYQAGECIGLSGASGLVTGPHLHFFLERDGLRLRLEDIYGIA